jgi:hypothetical protein
MLPVHNNNYTFVTSTSLLEKVCQALRVTFQLVTQNNLQTLLKYWLINIYVTHTACDALAFSSGSLTERYS